MRSRGAAIITFAGRDKQSYATSIATQIEGWRTVKTPCRSSNGMLPGLIVLAPSASFSFNRDHYPPGEDPPTCRPSIESAWSVDAQHATTFSSTLDGLLTYTNGCLTYLGHACLRPWVYGVRVSRIDAIPQLIGLPWRLANECTSVQERFSLFSLSIQINSLTEGPDAASRGKDDRGRARSLTYRLEVHYDTVERTSGR